MKINLSRARGSVRLAAVGLVVLAAAAAQPALAATDTATMDVSATVTENCVVSTTALSLTSGSNVDGTSTIDVTCTADTTWEATADAGGGTGASLTTRKMANGANLLDYALYTDSARTTIWGDGADATTSKISDTGTGSAQTKTIYGRVSSGQTSLPAGAYSDTVTVTVTY
jgi:spore coat protein U-like protein